MRKRVYAGICDTFIEKKSVSNGNERKGGFVIRYFLIAVYIMKVLEKNWFRFNLGKRMVYTIATLILVLVYLSTIYPGSKFLSSVTEIKAFSNRIGYSRSLIIVRTAYRCRSRLKFLLQSWIPSKTEQQKNNIYLVTDVDVDGTSYRNFSNVILTRCSGTHDLLDLCCKTAHEFELYYNLTSTGFFDYDWMCRFDDDQYVNLNSLYSYLSNFDASLPFYIGCTHTEPIIRVPEDPSRTFPYAIYGGGVCYSKAMLKRMRALVNKTTMPQMCLKVNFVDDTCLGYICVIKLNVSMTIANENFHAHVEKISHSFHQWDLDKLANMVTVGFSSHQYPMNRMLLFHEFVQLQKSEDKKQYTISKMLWNLQREFESIHVEDIIKFGKNEGVCGKGASFEHRSRS